jgi:positive regulator of sigma E activity
VLPVFALFAGAVLGRTYLPGYFKGTTPDALSAAGAFMLFLVSLLIAKLLSGKMGKKTEYKPVIESIIEE